MALQLIKEDVGFLDFTVIANQQDNIKWHVCKKVGGDYIADPSLAIAKYEYLTDNNGDPLTVPWGQMTYTEGADFINVTTYNDNSTIYISAVNAIGEAAMVSFDPYKLSLSSTRHTSVSTSVKLIGKKYNGPATIDLPDYESFKWSTNKRLSALSAYVDDDVYNLYTDAIIYTETPEQDAIRLYYNGSVVGANIKITADFASNPYLQNPATSANFNISTPPSITLYFNNIVTTSGQYDSNGIMTLSAMENGSLLPKGNVVSWDISDSTKVKAFSGVNLTSPYVFGKSSTNLSVIKLSTSDFTNVYEYILNSQQDSITGMYRPYKSYDSSSTLSAKLIKWDQDANTGEYTYIYRAIGKTGNILHALPPSQNIVWGYSGNMDITLFNNNRNVYYSPTIDTTAETADTVTVKINPEISNASPREFTETVSLNSANPNKTHSINIKYSGYVDNENLKPEFRFQYEDTNKDTIYRPLTATAYYTLSNTSIIPPNTKGAVIYTINNTVCSIPFTVNSKPTTGIKYTFNASTPRICTISIAVCALAAEYQTYVYKKTQPTKIVFTSVPKASAYKCYPEYTWNDNTGNWDLVVDNSNNILLSTTRPSAYGMNHTERFFLSAAPLPSNNNPIWMWNIQNISTPNDVFDFTSTENITWAPIKAYGHNSYKMRVKASIFNDTLDPSMPERYYDTPNGKLFDNFHVSDLISISGAANLTATSFIENVNTNRLPIPGVLSLTGSCRIKNDISPFKLDINSYNVNLSSSFWNIQQTGYISHNKFINETHISVDDIGSNILSLPKNEISVITVKPSPSYSLELRKRHPKVDDWRFDNIPISSVKSESNVTRVSAYPYIPLIYSPNYYYLVGDNVRIDNLMKCTTNVINDIRWLDRDNILNVNSCTPYITTYDKGGIYDIALYNTYVLDDKKHTNGNTFKSIIEIRDEHNLYDPGINRIYSKVDLNLPHSLDNCKIPPNEWIVEDTFNNMIYKLYDNISYLNNMSKIYSDPPTNYIGWLGALRYNNDVIRSRWHTSVYLNNYSYKNPERAVDQWKYKNARSCFVKGDSIYLTDENGLHILKNDFYGSHKTSRLFKSIGDDFSGLKNIKIGQNGLIYVLDSFNPDHLEYGSRNRMLVFSYDNDKWELLYEWGGLGGERANSKFNMPNDFCMDNNDNVLVADTDNYCIKKYTKSGGWISTISSTHFNDKPISITVGIDNNIYVLAGDNMHIFDQENNLIDIISINPDAIKIECCQDGGFIYALYTNRVLKYNLNGEVIGILAGDEFDESYIKDYRGIHHDANRNLYIICKNHILKYVDLLTMISIRDEDDEMLWNLDDLSVHKDEYIQDWVINRCFHRLWDNIEVFRRSIRGKFDYKISQVITQNKITKPLTPPDNFDFCEQDWFNATETIIEESVYEHKIPTIRSFTVNEYYDELPHTKKELIIGLNEIHSADVYNRIIERLYSCLEVLLIMIR